MFNFVSAGLMKGIGHLRAAVSMPSVAISVSLSLQSTHVEVAKVVPLLLLSHQRKCPALNAGWWVLNSVFCMILAKALKAVGMQVCDSDETRTGRARSRLLRRRLDEKNTHPAGKLTDH